MVFFQLKDFKSLQKRKREGFGGLGGLFWAFFVSYEIVFACWAQGSKVKFTKTMPSVSEPSAAF